MGIDFTQLLRGPSIGDQFQQGIQDGQAEADRQRKIAAQQQALRDQQAARTGIAAALSTGDYSKAAAQAALYGDDKSATVLAGIGKDGYDRASKNTTTMANLSNSVLAIPTLEGRKAAIQAAKPWLVAQGVSPADVDAFVPSDDNIHALGHTGYAYKDQVHDGIAQQNADSTTMNAQSARMTAEKPVVQAGGSVFDRTTNQPVYTAPQIVNAPATNNVVEVGGATSTNIAPGSVSAEQLYRTGLKPQESGGLPNGGAGAVGAQTKYGRAIGASQMLPATAASMAAKLGIPYRPDLMAAKTPEGLAYQDKLGIRYAQEALDASGGDPRKAAEYYFAGPDMSLHGPKTKAYGDSVMARLADSSAMQQRPVRTIQQATPQGQGSGSVVAGDLSSLPADRAAMIKAIAEGRAAAPNPRTKVGAELLAQVTAYDPTFDAANATTRVATRKDATSGKMAMAKTAINTAIGHMMTLDDTAKRLGNSSFMPGVVNPLYNAIRGSAGNTDLPAFEQTKQAVASELRKVFANTSGGTLQELQGWEAQLSSSKSYDQLHAVIRNGAELLNSRLEALRQQYEQGMGRSDITPAFVLPKNRAAIRQRFGLDLNDGTDTSRIPPAAIQQLRANPSSRAHFDQVFGAGAASRVLG